MNRRIFKSKQKNLKFQHVLLTVFRNFVGLYYPVYKIENNFLCIYLQDFCVIKNKTKL